MKKIDDLAEPTSWAPEGIGYGCVDNLESQIRNELLTEYGQKLIEEVVVETAQPEEQDLPVTGTCQRQ